MCCYRGGCPGAVEVSVSEIELRFNLSPVASQEVFASHFYLSGLILNMCSCFSSQCQRNKSGSLTRETFDLKKKIEKIELYIKCTPTFFC